jgi:hypothetical protein
VFGLHPDLRRHVAASWWAGVLAGAAGVILLVAWGRGEEWARALPRWPLAAVTFFLLLAAYLATVMQPRWYRRASAVVARGSPAAASVALEYRDDPDERSLAAEVMQPGVAGPPERVTLMPPARGLATLAGAPRPAEVFRDPESRQVLALRLDGTLLWALPGRRRWRG